MYLHHFAVSDFLDLRVDAENDSLKRFYCEAIISYRLTSRKGVIFCTNLEVKHGICRKYLKRLRKIVMEWNLFAFRSHLAKICFKNKGLIFNQGTLLKMVKMYCKTAFLGENTFFFRNWHGKTCGGGVPS